MNKCGSIEQRGVEFVMPLILRGIEPGSTVINTNEANNAVLWQRQVGDFIVRSRSMDAYLGIEVKTEERYTGNLFVESWSNKSHYRARDGWIFTLGSDLLFMVYLDVKAVFILDLPKLKNWCVTEGNMYRYPEKEVHRYKDGEQRNRTTGYPIPWASLVETVGFRCWQLQDGKFVNCIFPDLKRREPV